MSSCQRLRTVAKRCGLTTRSRGRAGTGLLSGERRSRRAPQLGLVRGHPSGNMRLLDKLYSSPAQLLAKARRDRDALLAAEKSGDEASVRDKLFDFSVSIHSMLDWIKSIHPNHEIAAFALLDSTPALCACRDIANSNKHYELSLESGPYRRFPPAVDDVDYSLSASVSHSLSASAGIDDGPTPEQQTPAPVQRLKVIYVAGSRTRIEDIANEAITAWEGFLSKHGIPGAP